LFKVKTVSKGKRIGYVMFILACRIQHLVLAMFVNIKTFYKKENKSQ